MPAENASAGLGCGDVASKHRDGSAKVVQRVMLGYGLHCRVNSCVSVECDRDKAAGRSEVDLRIINKKNSNGNTSRTYCNSGFFHAATLCA